MASYRANATTALELGGELLALAERSGDPALLLEGHHALWPVLIWSGRVSAARPHLEQGIALYDKTKHRAHAFVYGGHDPGVCFEVRQLGILASGLSGARSGVQRGVVEACRRSCSPPEPRGGARLGLRLPRCSTRSTSDARARTCPDARRR